MFGAQKLANLERGLSSFNELIEPHLAPGSIGNGFDAPPEKSRQA